MYFDIYDGMCICIRKGKFAWQQFFLGGTYTLFLPAVLSHQLCHAAAIWDQQVLSPGFHSVDISAPKYFSCSNSLKSKEHKILMV